MKGLSLALSFLILASCGQKSEVKPDFESRRISEQYGDKFSLILSLTDRSIDSYNSQLNSINFFGGGIAKMFFDIATAMGLGKGQLSILQPFPELPYQYVKSLKIKRVFFYLEPKEGLDRRHGWFREMFFGRSEATFNFLDRLVVKMSSRKNPQPNSLEPIVNYRSLNRRDREPVENLIDLSQLTKDDQSALRNEPTVFPLDTIFKDEFWQYYQSIPAKNKKEIYLVRYKDKNPEKYRYENPENKTFMIKTPNAVKLRRFIKENESLNKFVRRSHVLNDTIVLEIPNEPLVEEQFLVEMENKPELARDFDIKWIEGCSNETCLDLKVQQDDLLSLIKRGDAVQLDAFFDTNFVPESFQLKGFIEFELGLNLPF